MSAATSLYTAGQQLATTIGVSIGAVSLEVARVFSGHLEPQPVDFSVAFLVVGFMTLAAAPVALLMPRTAGDDLTGRRAEPLEPTSPKAGE
jgi:hypothetical protein